MTPVIWIVGIIGAALTFWNFSNWYGFVSGYRYNGDFQGKRYECRLRFATSECDSLCFIGANEFGLYLLYHPASKGWWWKYAAGGFNRNLEIPWRDLDYRPAKILFKDCMQFEIPPRKVYFWVPKDVGDQLLIDARRKTPTPNATPSWNSRTAKLNSL
ncbi:MAG: hypothetical protein WBV31_07025 [Terriglobales bacterium]